MNFNLKKITLIALSSIAVILTIIYSGRLAEEVEAGEIVVIQHPLSGKLDVITTPGTYSQYLGKADAAKAKWDQEVIKAKLITEAQQQKEVAALEAQTAILNAQKTKTDADAESYKNARLVSAGLSPIDRAEYEMQTKIGVAEALSKIVLPGTYMSGMSNNGQSSMLEAILGSKLLNLEK